MTFQVPHDTAMFCKDCGLVKEPFTLATDIAFQVDDDHDHDDDDDHDANNKVEDDNLGNDHNHEHNNGTLRQKLNLIYI